MPLIPAYANTDLVSIEIRIDGTVIDPNIGIIRIDVEHGMNSIPKAYLLIQDGDVATQDFAQSNSDDFIPGKVIDIQAGYNNTVASIFQGVIIKQRVKAQKRGGTSLQIECRDLVYKMTLDRKSTYFKDVSNEDIFQALVGQYSGLSFQNHSLGLPTTFPEVTQYQMTDWDFFMMRLEHAGMYAIIENGKINTHSLPAAYIPSLKVEMGVNLFSFDIEMDSRNQFEAIKAKSWNPSNLSILEAEATSISTPSQGNLTAKKLAAVAAQEKNLVHGGALSQDALDAWVEAQTVKAEMSKLKGTLVFQGNGEVLPGNCIEVAGISDRYNGTAFVSGVQHSIGQGDWETTAEIGFSPKWHYEIFEPNAIPGSGISTAISGLQIGIITQLEGDPDGNERLLVRLPIINDSDEGNWMRWASLDAGAERGMIFRPEIGDEVVVGFLNDDPNQGVILGSLHSSGNAAPIIASDDNHEKGYVSRSQLKVLFDDDKKIVTLSTPNGNECVLSDDEGSISLQDENGNSITLNRDGIEIKSAGEISIKAGRDLLVEGVNVQQKASASFKAEGGAGAELSTSAILTLKGSLVKIN